MKKLLVLALVLGMASMASATLQISINGNETINPPVIVLNPSETCTLDVYTDTGIPSGGAMDAVLIVDTACGNVSGGIALLPNGSKGRVVGLASENVEGLPDGQDGQLMSLGAPDNAIDVSAKIFDQFVFHCESANGPTVISLFYVDEDGVVTDTLFDSVIINQIPEPATIALLGLGGLLLKRRK